MNFFRKKTANINTSSSSVSVDTESLSSRSTSISRDSSQVQKNSGVTFVPFDKPISPIKRAEFDLDSSQKEKYEEVLHHFQIYAEKEIPIDGQSGSPSCKLTEEELSWLTEECFLRYLRATKWKKEQAIKRIEDTLLWRRSFGIVYIPDYSDPAKKLTPDSVAKENETGKQLILGYDVDNRPCLYLKNGYQNTPPSFRQVQHLVFMLERVIQFMPPGQDTLALLIDFKAAPPEMKLSSSFPSLSISKQVLHILQHHYPERLGRGMFTNIPWIGYTFFKVVGPFIDPYTRSKTIYDQPFEQYVPKEQLDKEFNGLLDFKYVHGIYWPEMNRLADKKHKIYMENFAKLGRKIGLSEFDLRLENKKMPNMN